MQPETKYWGGSFCVKFVKTFSRMFSKKKPRCMLRLLRNIWGLWPLSPLCVGYSFKMAKIWLST